jgi:hypothetical protein
MEELTLEAINARFNEELQQQVDGTLPKGHVYKLGMPQSILQSAGIDNFPIELSAERLKLKSSKDYRREHPFDLSEIKDLPQAINNPIAVFDSTKKDGSKIILVELQHNGNNFVAVMRVRKDERSRKFDIEVNDIKSIYPKSSTLGIIDWINSKDNLLKWVDKEKASRFISTQSTNLIGGGNKATFIVELFSKQRYNSAEVRKLFNHATKIVQDFENPKFSEEKMNVPKATPSKALKQIIDNTPTTIKKQIDMKKTLTLALLLSAAVCGAQTHFPKNFNVDLGGGVNDAGCYTPVVAVGYTFNNWFALYGRYSFATDKVEDGRLTYWEHTGEIYPSFTVLSYMDKWFVSPFVGAAYKYQELLGIPTSSRDVTGHNFGAVIGVEGEWHFARYLSAFAGVSYRGLFFKEEPRYEPCASVGVRTSMRVVKKAGRRR